MFGREGEGWSIKTFYKLIITSGYMLELNIFFTLNYMDLIYTLKIDLMLFLQKLWGGGGGGGGEVAHTGIYIYLKPYHSKKKGVSTTAIVHSRAHL